jgi:hypothetical protein
MARILPGQLPASDLFGMVQCRCYNNALQSSQWQRLHKCIYYIIIYTLYNSMYIYVYTHIHFKNVI